MLVVVLVAQVVMLLRRCHIMIVSLTVLMLHLLLLVLMIAELLLLSCWLHGHVLVFAAHVVVAVAVVFVVGLARHHLLLLQVLHWHLA